MPKETLLDLKSIAKELGTGLKKTSMGTDYIKYNMKTVKGELHYEGSGGMYFKSKDLGLDCYIDHGKILDQIEEVEKRAAAYKALLADLKNVKRAVLKGTRKLPEKRNAVGSTKTSKVVSRSSRRAEKEASAEKRKG